MIVHVPFWTRREKGNVRYVIGLLIYIVLIASIIYGCALITNNTKKYNVAEKKQITPLDVIDDNPAKEATEKLQKNKKKYRCIS